MAMALAAALPGSLDGTAAALGLPYGKDATGAKLMREMCQPRVNHDDAAEAERLIRLGEYCKRDVELTRELYRRLPPLNDQEQKIWRIDQRINMNGIPFDRTLVDAARELARWEAADVDGQIATLTQGRITSVSQVSRITEYVREQGHSLKSLNKRSVSAVLARGEDDEARQLLKLRREGAGAAVRKLTKLAAQLGDDDRLRGALRFHGAATGRWSSIGVQVQNLKKPETANLDGAIAAVLAHDREALRRFGAPLAVLGDMARAMIKAAPGQHFIGADLSAIESRVLAWLAGETWKLDTYQKFDATGDPTIEPYRVVASKVLRRPIAPDDDAARYVGKIADLACGYGGSIGAWRRFANDEERSDDAVKADVMAWRRAHPMICRFWRALDAGAKRAIRFKQPFTIGRLTLTFADDTLRIILPSGRAIHYPQARFVPGKYDTEIAFMDNARGGWSEARAWYGTLTENVVQGIARDLLAAAIARLEYAEYWVCLHVHDEVVCEVADDFGSTDELLALMTAAPAWAGGLPIAAKAWSGQRYSAKGEGPAPGGDMAEAEAAE
jgi:DNA polymerase